MQQLDVSVTEHLTLQAWQLNSFALFSEVMERLTLIGQIFKGIWESFGKLFTGKKDESCLYENLFFQKYIMKPDPFFILVFYFQA